VDFHIIFEVLFFDALNFFESLPGVCHIISHFMIYLFT